MFGSLGGVLRGTDGHISQKLHGLSVVPRGPGDLQPGSTFEPPPGPAAIPVSVDPDEPTTAEKHRGRNQAIQPGPARPGTVPGTTSRHPSESPDTIAGRRPECTAGRNRAFARSSLSPCRNRGRHGGKGRNQGGGGAGVAAPTGFGSGNFANISALTIESASEPTAASRASNTFRHDRTFFQSGGAFAGAAPVLWPAGLVFQRFRVVSIPDPSRYLFVIVTDSTTYNKVQVGKTRATSSCLTRGWLIRCFFERSELGLRTRGGTSGVTWGAFVGSNAVCGRTGCGRHRRLATRSKLCWSSRRSCYWRSSGSSCTRGGNGAALKHRLFKRHEIAESISHPSRVAARLLSARWDAAFHETLERSLRDFDAEGNAAAAAILRHFRSRRIVSGNDPGNCDRGDTDGDLRSVLVGLSRESSICLYSRAGTRIAAP